MFYATDWAGTGALLFGIAESEAALIAARALIGAPPVIIADEPTSALDADAQAAFLDLLFQEAGQSGATVLFVSHDRRLDAGFDRVVALAEINRAAGAEGRAA